jgi:hypothetical protein
MRPPLTRRHFLTTTAATLLATKLPAQTARIDVAAFEHDRILAEAPSALAANPTATPDLSHTIATLTAAFLLTKDPAYATRAAAHLTTLTQQNPHPTVPITDLIPLAEAAVALRFLTDTFDPTPIDTWFSALQTNLTENRTLRIARDLKDHRASAWLLISSAIARSQRDEKSLDFCRAHLRRPTLRNQITADGSFPQELATPFPYRNTLFNFDLLFGAAQLLADPFNKLWDYELPDGPGLRSVAACLFPLIEDPTRWTSVADAQHFRDLPGRRPALLFAGRAYNRSDYVYLWRSLPTTIPPELADTFPIRQPLLWTTRAPHGF